MPLPLVLAGAKAALGAAKAAKAAKALKAAKSMKAAGSAAKGAKGAGAPKKLMTEGFNNVGSKANLKASKEKLKTAKKQERLQKGADRLVKRDQRRTEMKKNMEARAKEQEQQSSGESKKKKESIKELYDKSREGLERKDRRSEAMSNFATKGKMKHGGKYKKGGRKPGALHDKIAKAAGNRASTQRFKSKVNKARADRMSEKAASTKSKIGKALREEVARLRGDQARGQADKAKRATKVSKFASKRGEIARNRAKNKAAKAKIRAKYENGGRKKSDPVKEARKKIDAANAADKSTAGRARQSSLKSKNTTQALIERSRGAGSLDAAKLIAKKGLAPRTMIPKGALSEGTQMAKDFRERDRKTGMSPKSSRYQVKNKGKEKALKNKSLKK